MSAGDRGQLRLGRRDRLDRRGGDRARCTSAARPRRDETHVPDQAGALVDSGESAQSLSGRLRARPVGRLAVLVLSPGLALPLGLDLRVHHVRRARAAGLVGLVLRLLALRQSVLALGEIGLARLHERSSRYAHAGRIVKRVLGSIGQRRGAVEYQRPLVQSGAS